MDRPATGVFFGHTKEGAPPEEWQALEAHLRGVSERAARFASAFGSGEWGRLAGLWHDLGKYSGAFQEYLRAATSPDAHEAERTARIDHSSAGAQHAVSSFGWMGHLLAFPIAGHHSGLLDALGEGACLEARLRKELDPWSSAPPDLRARPRPDPPKELRDALGTKDGFRIAFFVRMLFSCLVDADFLDTEEFMDPDRAAGRPSWPEDVLARMAAALERHIEGFDPKPTQVNRQRALVLEACLEASDRPPGIYSLTVPTGGGKTLSSLAFALNHAVIHGLRRVVYVVPFTSIIEQNAGVFRDALSPLERAGFPDPVVEHHSSLDPERETARNRLASENWDAPLIVTTGVQFYESLFANRTSRCRKLHNLARSVIVLDEAQALPVDFLHPCLRALEEFRRSYGATVLLCTATQPAVRRRPDFRIGLDLAPEHEIVPDPGSLFQALKRVEVERRGKVADEGLADEMMEERQALCIVNTRRHARRLAELLGQGEEGFHLSALMCPEHRADCIARIRDRLHRGLECRVVSTRLIEAGVDLDFPVVFRAISGLDSIAQAAGRCNRNGTLPMGRVVVFEPEDTSAERFVADTAGSARQILPLYDDPLSPEAVEHYFRLHYWDRDDRWDSRDILGEFALDQNADLPFLFGFAQAASRFRLIDDGGKPVIVPWREEGRRLCDELRRSRNGPSVNLRRRLQRYTVQVPARAWRELHARALEIVQEQFPVLVLGDDPDSVEALYSERFGLALDRGSSGLLMV